MVLEKNDYFVIADKPQTFTNSLGIEMPIRSDFDGMVFQALEVCGDFVAAKIVEADPDLNKKPVVLSLNYTLHQIMTVTKAYAEALMNSRRLEMHPDNSLGGPSGDLMSDMPDVTMKQFPTEDEEDNLF
jgi:hypothetical protein